MSHSTLAVEFDARRIDAIFAQLDQCRLPGAAVGIAIRGRPVYREGFGLASIELPVLLSPSTRMRICSVTKHFAAFAYMLLCEEGSARIDDPLVKYLPEMHRVTHQVSMRQLMGNISGLRDVHGLCWQLSGMQSSVSSADLLSLYRSIDDVNFAPGGAYCYNNGGFLLLSAAIERITGRSLEEVLRERVFEPVGMYATLLRRSDSQFVSNCATAHMTTPSGTFERLLVGTSVAGEGGIVSTVDDMLRWLAHMDAPKVGKLSTWAVMKAPQILANGTSTGYGLGLATGHYRGVETLTHPGGWLGANAQMLKVPAAGLDIVVMVNRHDVSSTVLANKILDACLPGLEPAEEGFNGPFFTGTFRSSRTHRVIRLLAKEGQQIVAVDGMDMSVYRDEDGVFRPMGLMGFLKQAVNLIGDPAQPASLCLDDYGNLDELAPAHATNKPDLRTICGRYCSDSTGAEATVFGMGDGWQLRTAGPFGSIVYDLESLADGIWQLKSTTSAAQWSGIVSFEGDGRQLRLSSWSNWALPFRRCA